MRSAFTLWVAVLMLTSACQSDPDPRYTGWLGASVQGEKVDLSGLQPPEQIELYRLQGEMEFPERNMRMFRYQHDQNADRKLDIALYPLPPGFAELSGERAVAGHYGTVKQSMAERLTERHNSSIETRSEQLREPEGLPYPVAEGVFQEIASQWTRTLVLLVGVREPLFIRATSDFTDSGDEDAARLDNIRAATRAFLESDGGSPDAAGE